MFTATLFGEKKICVEFENHTDHLHVQDFKLDPAVRIKQIRQQGNLYLVHTDPLSLNQTLHLTCKDHTAEIIPDTVLDRYRSNKEMGCSWDAEQTFFRLFSPRAKQITLLLYNEFGSDKPDAYDMQRDGDGVWERVLPGHHFGKYYAYSAKGPEGVAECFDEKVLIGDPYSRAVARDNSYHHRSISLIIDPADYDWQGDIGVRIPPEELIIYECHLRDMTADPSSGVSPDLAGTYRGLCQTGIRGGLEYIKSLGVNAVEFLPVHEFANLEIPYGIKTDGVLNSWNPYSRNHWGYMTSYFFAPESCYATQQSLQSDFCGVDGREIFEFKDVVRAVHQSGMAVILDVVFNHVSHYDQNCFKYLGKSYYFRLDKKGEYLKTSGCGNDFKTERPMARKMILDCLKYWMREYHIDGFRFDLAALIDLETVNVIASGLREINPDIILIAEPWGGGKYRPAEFSQHDWAAWNDQFRNGVKGENPQHGQGFIFGKWWGGNNKETLKRYIGGTLINEGGMFKQPGHSVNYLASHDDYALGDFIRIGSGKVGPETIVTDMTSHVKLDAREMRLNKLAALVLFTSRGACMVTAGQEYAHSKVIARTTAPDYRIGRIDNNSYNKDNQTNWINYDFVDLNSELVEYYRKLVHMRKTKPVFSDSSAKLEFIDHPNPFALGYHYSPGEGSSRPELLVFINGDNKRAVEFELPAGKWKIVISETGETITRFVENRINLSPGTGIVLE